ncbi:AI-2E family transporter [Mycobacterium sp. E740]|uniref:AI-2E family transporter n=1 Tax=Mycobacterium sp. E740 TaxID=1834149 RepID=UPI0007FD3D8B|nr:AI-2E family transporter [Mycobacterium sp. E740]OBI82130.1 AI-2E family transporter [Mycobacterium sp. E740]
MPEGVSLDDEAVSPLVRKAAAWSWRLLLIFAAIFVLLWTIKRLEIIVVPVALATMLAALLMPAVDSAPLVNFSWLSRRAWIAASPERSICSRLSPSGPSISQVRTPSMLRLTWLVNSGAPSMNWLIDGPLGLSREQIERSGDAAIQALRDNQEKLTSGALSTAGTVTEIVTGALLVLFTLIFLLQGGRNIYAFITRIFPSDVRERVRDAGRAGFHSLIGYIRATFLVALVDAIGIGTGLAIMGVPLALPLASLVFLGAFVPLVGAVVTGFLAVIVALIAKGMIYALITLGLIIAVQQLEGHVLQPLVMGRAVSIHPLAIVLVIAGGGVLAGIVGALLAVPTLAFLNSAVRVLTAPNPDAEAAALESDDGPLVKAESDDVD